MMRSIKYILIPFVLTFAVILLLDTFAFSAEFTITNVARALFVALVLTAAGMFVTRGKLRR